MKMPPSTLYRLLCGCLVAMALCIGSDLRLAKAELKAGEQTPALTTTIVYLTKDYQEPPPLSLVDKEVKDKGIQGARIALDEDNRTGRLLGQHYDLMEVLLGKDASPVEKAKELLAAGQRIIVADLESADLLAVADLPEASNALIFDVRTSDDVLRQEQCRANIFHVPPNWAMRADALAQYLMWKKWRHWVLIVGKSPADEGYAAAIRRAAKRFGAKIVAERPYVFEAGSRRTDTGHQQIQTQMPMLTQGVPDHDVIIVADESDVFGDYLLFRTAEPRPVAGTHGLVAVAWHRAFEEYAGTQMQNRFERKAGRIMTERDYTAWLAVRIVGEAVTRTGKNSPDVLRDYILSEKFEVAGFKGQGMNFRSWDLQLRQPLLIAGPRALVSISPQEGFLHPKYLTDTLGFDQPETKCRLTAKH
ncbi:ABC transporter substrate-binding protein [Hyphomicrobium sp. NDB2Meth4]|uniref:ABC transporter substrate-binding protein n=1 Tax=Hyphomicrobium sp. NDB2Meth4 TaxID=1892846 RepID=UPI0009304025|nr:ABC transporter substrate-binding protein [Hyphomicrobium sp. NDB2Meth4]